MKKYLLRAGGTIAMAALLSTSVSAQSDKNKLNDDDVIVITKKGGKDSRVTIEVRDGEVTVNGKPLDEYKDGDVIIRRGRSTNATGIYSPFRQGQGGSWQSIDGLVETKGSSVAYLGVVTEKADQGARITSVSDNTAADKAGLKEGDIITHIDEDRIDDHDDLTKAIRKHKPEDKITVTVQRDGRERQVAVTLGKTGGSVAMVAPSTKSFPSTPVMPKYNYDFNEDFNRAYTFGGRVRLGIQAQDTEDGRGAKVLKVDNDSPADKAGIRAGDVITEFEGKNIDDADDLASAARSVKDQSSMSVRLQRDGRSQTVEVKVPKKLRTTNL